MLPNLKASPENEVLAGRITFILDCSAIPRGRKSLFKIYSCSFEIRSGRRKVRRKNLYFGAYPVFFVLSGWHSANEILLTVGKKSFGGLRCVNFYLRHQGRIKNNEERLLPLLFLYYLRACLTKLARPPYLYRKHNSVI